MKSANLKKPMYGNRVESSIVISINGLTSRHHIEFMMFSEDQQTAFVQK